MGYTLRELQISVSKPAKKGGAGEKQTKSMEEEKALTRQKIAKSYALWGGRAATAGQSCWSKEAKGPRGRAFCGGGGRPQNTKTVHENIWAQQGTQQGFLYQLPSFAPLPISERRPQSNSFFISHPEASREAEALVPVSTPAASGSVPPSGAVSGGARRPTARNSKQQKQKENWPNLSQMHRRNRPSVIYRVIEEGRNRNSKVSRPSLLWSQLGSRALCRKARVFFLWPVQRDGCRAWLRLFSVVYSTFGFFPQKDFKYKYWSLIMI